LVELLGSERLDVPVNRAFLLKMREAVAKALDLEVDDVKRITADLILA
jgi:phage baseplate assembly protein W